MHCPRERIWFFETFVAARRGYVSGNQTTQNGGSITGNLGNGVERPEASAAASQAGASYDAPACADLYCCLRFLRRLGQMKSTLCPIALEQIDLNSAMILCLCI